MLRYCMLPDNHSVHNIHTTPTTTSIIIIINCISWDTSHNVCGSSESSQRFFYITNFIVYS